MAVRIIIEQKDLPVQYVSHVVDQLLHDQHGGAWCSEVLVMSSLPLDQHGHCRTVCRILLDRDAGRQRSRGILRIVNYGLLWIGARYVDNGLLVQRIVRLLLMMLLLLMLLLVVVLLLLLLLMVVLMVIVGRLEFVHAHRLHGG